MRYRPAEALLTASSAFGRLTSLSGDEGVDMPERTFEQLQARALNNLDDAGSDGQAALLARAQVHALLAVGAAIKDLAEATRQGQ
ncbi:hypothetical protein [Streptomyces sp. NBC_00932]|uniref:hypothetical protein n=1 Tax=Streptomyces sp. NBC_00932 TaxID=2903690 RepID=UPI0038659923|nr:hypothetical protein OG221_27915 [Streptomyces sp. NBC_00932]